MHPTRLGPFTLLKKPGEGEGRSNCPTDNFTIRGTGMTFERRQTSGSV
jgi:hypothetical protein